MDLQIAGKGAVVFGAGADVGRETALLLAAEGARLVLVGRRREPLEETAAQIAGLGGQAFVATADARDAEEVRRVVEMARSELSGIELVANTIGPFPHQAEGASELPAYGDDVSWLMNFENVFMTAARIAREVMPGMKAAGAGALVNLASASVRYYNTRTVQYGAMKAALAHATKNWARDGAPHGVRVNAVLPGWIRGQERAAEIEERARTQGTSPAEVERAMVAQSGAVFWGTRMGTPQDYAAAIVFLLSSRASYINGALLPVDGGTAG